MISYFGPTQAVPGASNIGCLYSAVRGPGGDVSSMLMMSRTARVSCGGHAPRPRDVANMVLLEYVMKRVPDPFV